MAEDDSTATLGMPYAPRVQLSPGFCARPGAWTGLRKVGPYPGLESGQDCGAWHEVPLTSELGRRGQCGRDTRAGQAALRPPCWRR